MDDIPLGILFGLLVLLILLSAFFSSSETGMMALNRYRMRHLAKSDHRGARKAARLLEKPDRLIGLILLGNNSVNILASALATMIGFRLYGEIGIAIATGLLTFVILIFAELTPKTYAVLHPEKVAYPAAWLLEILLVVLGPLVALTNAVSNRLLRAAGIHADKQRGESLSNDELRMVVNEAGAMIPDSHQKMLTGILDLERITVDDIMVPRNEITGIDLNLPEEDIEELLFNSPHTRLPVYRDNINDIIGLLHLRNAVRLFGGREDFDKEALAGMVREPYFIPEGTPLHTQLLNFQRRKHRIAMVVDEYGDIQGLVMLEDILEEIVGEFTTDPDTLSPDVHPQDDGTFLIDGTATIRELNKTMHWDLPVDGPRTLNGLLLEYLESIPERGTSLLVAGYPFEVVQASENSIKVVRIKPDMRQGQDENAGDEPGD